MPKSSKPKAKRASAKTGAAATTKPAPKTAWYQAFNGAAGQHAERPSKTGKKAQNKSA